MTRTYSYKGDWDSIHQKSDVKPWEEAGVAPVLKSFFEKEENKRKYKTSRIVDIGCGDGQLCEYLYNQGYQDVTGIDVSRIALNKCPQNPIIHYECNDIINGDFAGKKYDIVVCWFLLHHIKKSHLKRFVLRLFELCDVNGILMLSFLLPERGKKNANGRHSFFSEEHNLYFYRPEKVVKLFSPYFQKSISSDAELLEKPDEHMQKYHYYTLIMEKGIKEELSGMVSKFKNEYIVPNSGVYDKINNIQYQTQKLLKLLNDFSSYSRNVERLMEKDFSELFNGLFRNVSRFVGKKVLETQKEESRKDVVILKMDLHDQTSIYSAIQYGDSCKIEYPHCKFNAESNDNVNSRAYELFFKYVDYLKQLPPHVPKYTLHKHFHDNPNLRYISFFTNNGSLMESTLETELKPVKEEYTKDYCSFLKYIFKDNKTIKKVGRLDNNNKKKNYKDFDSYVRDVRIDEQLVYKVKSFSCFNLGISGFESWGSLLIESSQNADVIKDLFYQKKAGVYEGTELLQDIKNIVFILKKIEYDYYDALANKKIKIQSIKSVVAALMSRNMSHNLGSHFLTNTKNYFDKRIGEIVSSHKPNKQIIAADYRGNAHLLHYLKERMDFIATVVSGDKFPMGALNFKAQLFDLLTEDDHGLRHGKLTENFLLKYLVYSEQLTRFDGKLEEGFQEVALRVKIRGFLSQKQRCKIYTGKADLINNEENLKLLLSGIELSVPGGLMARHAFFTIIENIIRNSAKHSKANDDLIVTLELDKVSKSELNLHIYDNRRTGKQVKVDIENRFKNLVIIKEDGSVDKSSKGLKEMLICAIWLKNEDVASKLYEIQALEGDSKLDLISKYIKVSNAKDGSLRYTITISLFETIRELIENKDFVLLDDNRVKMDVDSLINLHADIICAKKDYYIEETGRKLSSIFPRFIEIGDKELKELFRLKDLSKLYERWKPFEKLCPLGKYPIIAVESANYPSNLPIDDGVVVKKASDRDDDWYIKFKQHFEQDTDEESKIKVIENAAGRYLESVTGENYTSTIASYDFLKDKVNRYKVVESALTKIVIIDERIYGDYKSRWGRNIDLEQKILEMKGVYLFNLNENGAIIDLTGNKFKKPQNAYFDFVSIHLGLIEKYKGRKGIIKVLVDKFGNKDNKPFIAVHSGRGNFSQELEEKLRDYPFLSLSALEAAFYDCKYFLTQLFKNTNYYGKGNINHQ